MQDAAPGGPNRRFPGYDVRSQAATWDPVTAAAVTARTRVRDSDLRFFTRREAAVASVLLDHLLAQWDEPGVPVLHMVDERLADGHTDGWRYADMPEDGRAWRASLAGLDRDARDRHEGSAFVALTRSRQARLIRAIRELGDTPWHTMPAGRVWSLWTRYACTAFYAHPLAWNETGFGGPAYPRGYARTGVDRREAWEVADADPRDPVARGPVAQGASGRQPVGGQPSEGAPGPGSAAAGSEDAR
ncbi:gluconate 2-dehydrogenase subunit 3 family protein [Streptomyces sp. SID3343]|nr:gluconate 2-dehydrogenase subunit 3 family protein [Streptomyces sp. SID3343]